MRLPRRKAIAFCIHYYVTRLDEIREEGNGAALREKLESMPEKLRWYKRRPFWMRDVEEFLRGQG